MQKNNQDGFIEITLIILLALGILGGGAYAYTKHKAKVKIEPTISIDATTTAPIEDTTPDASVTASAKIGPGLDINTDLGIEFSTLANSVKDQSNGSYAKVCDTAKTYFSANSNTNVAGEIMQTSKVALTAHNYLTADLKCKATAKDYVLTVPFTRDDKVQTKLCVSSTGVALGDANFDTMTCIKKF